MFFLANVEYLGCDFMNINTPIRSTGSDQYSVLTQTKDKRDLLEEKNKLNKSDIGLKGSPSAVDKKDSENTLGHDEKFKVVDESQVKAKSQKDINIKAEIRRLLSFQNKVIQHERAHAMVGGGLAGNPSYIYTTGPDGKKYISGGEVSIRIPGGTTMEDTLAMVQKVKAAAMAPADPSPQDIKTASKASSIELSIRREIAIKKAKTAYKRFNKISQEIKEKLENIDIERSTLLKSIDGDDVDKYLELSINKANNFSIAKFDFRILSKFELMI